MAVKSGSNGGMQVDTALVRELAAMLNDTGLSEIEVEDGERKIRVSRTMTAVATPVAAAPAAAAPAPAAAPAEAPKASNRRQRAQIADGRHRLSDARPGSRAVCCRWPTSEGGRYRSDYRSDEGDEPDCRGQRRHGHRNLCRERPAG